ncbi:MAG: acyl-CoA desaturase [Bacteroidetes bacterium]|nr:MAG: acyl-CoA desaturase [Bacteroidota bacterium]
MPTQISFAQEQNPDFKKTLYSRVNEYFSDKGVSKHHNPSMVSKTVVMLLLYFIPFIAILSIAMPFWLILILFFVMGVGIAGIGMSVMHDANHAGYSTNQNINRWLGLTLNLIGADAYNWKIKHNKLHHVFTNVYGKDEDIDSRVVLRFAFAAPLKKYHRYQHIYAWFFYALMTFSMVFGDIPKRIRYRKKGITNISVHAYHRSMAWLVFSKIFYFAMIIGLPLIFTSLLWWQVLLGFVVMHITAGTILSLVFQMAHVVEGPEQILPDENGKLPDSLLLHQLKTTSDFSRRNKLLSWYVGGLNFQVEHHLFPRICHVHYPAISEIVEKTTSEFKMPYYVYDRFLDAFQSHIRTLKKLGRVQMQSS